jgi:hypothetical protein
VDHDTKVPTRPLGQDSQRGEDEQTLHAHQSAFHIYRRSGDLRVHRIGSAAARLTPANLGRADEVIE